MEGSPARGERSESNPADGGKVGVVHRPSRRKSEGIVVAGKQGNSCGAKGSYGKSEIMGQTHSRLPQAITGKKWCVWLMKSELVTMNACRKAGCGKSASPV